MVQEAELEWDSQSQWSVNAPGRWYEFKKFNFTKIYWAHTKWQALGYITEQHNALSSLVLMN